MRVSVIGSGNVATVLAKMLCNNGQTIVQVYSRNPDHAQSLARLCRAEAVSDLQLVNDHADIYLFAVSDDVLEPLAGQLQLPGKLLVHTAGSVSKAVLQKSSDQFGVIWPMKMIRKPMDTMLPVTLVIDGNTDEVTNRIEAFAKLVSPMVTRADDATRLKMHMLASITANFPNHLYHLAADYCEQEKIPFSAFYPIIQDTTQQIQERHPEQVQAGPAFRGDIKTIENHLSLLSDYPQIRSLYETLTNSIQTLNQLKMKK